jgi:iron(II)-dependent oxidoreductase
MRSTEAISMLQDARKRTLESWADMSEKQLRVPPLPIINPPLWEMGHVAWFQEKWILRQLRGRPPLRPDADALWDSTLVPQDDRWKLPQLSRQETLAYMKEVLDRVIDALPQGDLTEQEAHLHWLAVMHEDMHGEALLCARQTLGRPEPRLSIDPPSRPATSKPLSQADADVRGGTFLLGAERGVKFAFDSEKWAHEVDVRPFRIARLATTNGEFLEFVEDGGYRRRELWSHEGWLWREKEHAVHPAYWIRMAGNWYTRQFDLVQPLDEDLPVVHVNWYEAEAYCRWARRRLPAEAEWEFAASGGDVSYSGGRKRLFPWGDDPPAPDKAHLDAAPLGCIPAAALPAGDSSCGCRQMIGNVWEWTSSTFQPYPGFAPDSHQDHKLPAFGEPRKVLRGGSWATRSRLIRHTWRHCQSKDRRDTFAGFRTCALE